jgi:uncharacterized membrane protein
MFSNTIAYIKTNTLVIITLLTMLALVGGVITLFINDYQSHRVTLKNMESQP